MTHLYTENHNAPKWGFFHHEMKIPPLGGILENFYPVILQKIFER